MNMRPSTNLTISDFSCPLAKIAQKFIHDFFTETVGRQTKEKIKTL